MKLQKIIKMMDDELDVSKMKDISLNGLQVEGKEVVKKAAFAVDASLSTIQKVAKEKADLLVVHHGLFWSKGEMITGAIKKRMKALFDNNISLYAVHLPLDRHPKLGNNAALAKIVGMKMKKKFGFYHDEYWGFEGSVAETTTKKIAKLLAKTLGATTKIYSFGKEKVKKVGIVSGGGMFCVPEAAEKGIDLVITGEPSYSNYHIAKELGVNVICAGHYATETLGVQALGNWLAKRSDIEVFFIENKVPL